MAIQPPTERSLKQSDLEAARRQTFAQKFMAGAELFDYACKIAEAGIRMQYPVYNDAEVQAELRRRVELGAIFEARQ